MRASRVVVGKEKKFDPHFLLNEAYRLLRQSRVPEAKEKFCNLLKKAQLYHPSLIFSAELGLVRCEEVLHDYFKVKKLLIKLTRKYLDDVQNRDNEYFIKERKIYLKWAIYYHHLNDFEKAAQSLNCITNKNDTTVIETWINHYLKQGNMEKAHHYTMILNASCSKQLHYNEIFQGTEDNLLEAIKKELLVEVPNANVILTATIKIFEKMKENKLQGEYFSNLLFSYLEQAIQRFPTSNVVKTLKAYRAKIQYLQGRSEVAFKEFRVIEKEYPFYWKCYRDHAFCLIQSDLLNESTAILKKIIDIKDHIPLALRSTTLAEIYHAIALNYLNSNDYRQTFHYLTMAQKENEDYAPLWSTFGKYYHEGGNKKKAQACFDKARQLDSSRYNRLHGFQRATFCTVAMEESSASFGGKTDPVCIQKNNGISPSAVVNNKSQKHTSSLGQTCSVKSTSQNYFSSLQDESDNLQNEMPASTHKTLTCKMRHHPVKRKAKRVKSNETKQKDNAEEYALDPAKFTNTDDDLYAHSFPSPYGGLISLFMAPFRFFSNITAKQADNLSEKIIYTKPKLC